MRFTTDEAFEAQAQGDPIFMELGAAQKIFADHSCEEPWDSYVQEMTASKKDPLDAANLLGWLGY